ncbi:MAG: 6-phosphofructokinase [Anaerolineae bacterium]
MKRIAVLTSGGDAPGMNAAIRAVVRAGWDKDFEMYGVQHGYAGLLSGAIRPLGVRDVGGILGQGGTMLGSARAPEFKNAEGQQTALRHLNQQGIDAVIVIGGNGSQTGAHALHKLGVPVVGVASTIDNDLYGSEVTIGVDTALNIALEAIDRLRVTASSHKRAFLVEVMGRDCGYLAMMAGLAGGAEMIIIPEVPCTPEDVVDGLHKAYERGKQHGLVVVAEGADSDVDVLMKFFKGKETELGFDVRATTLGHVQRGGVPSAFDRVLATRLGAAAVAALARGESGVLMGLNENKITPTPLEIVVVSKKALNPEMLELVKILAK